MAKIPVTAVSYLNTKPFLYGIEHHAIMSRINLVREMPAALAESMMSGKAAIGLLPVAVIPEISGLEIISDYGIASDGEVSSVCLYSQIPLKNVNKIYLDYQSRTSVELTKILIRDFWKTDPVFKDAAIGYESEIKEDAAGLIIGDRALQLKNKFNYCYDLGKAWKELTGLPFVFACWVANMPLLEDFVVSFNESLSNGVAAAERVAEQNRFFYPGIDTVDYLTNKIKYSLTPEMKKGLKVFLAELQRVHAS